MNHPPTPSHEPESTGTEPQTKSTGPTTEIIKIWPMNYPAPIEVPVSRNAKE